MTKTPDSVRSAVEGATEKKALDLAVLDVKNISSFTDYFLICTGTSSRHNQAISDEIDRRMRQDGLRALHIEGYNHAEWILMDYGEIVAHIFSERSRAYYDLERLWRTARRIPAQGIR